MFLLRLVKIVVLNVAVHSQVPQVPLHLELLLLMSLSW